MDVSLEDLQSALQAAQQQQSSARLSERNIVELISKLQELDFLGEDLLHSINGKEYLTKQHLCEEVRDSLDQTGGRVALVELPALLGVDLIHCERAAATVVGDSPGIFSIQGELMTAAHLDSLASEADQLLQEAGVIAIGELARRYKLTTEFVHSLVEQRLDTLIHGRMHSGLIFTAAFVGRIKGQLRGALRGALRPVTMQLLLKLLGIDVGAALGGQGAPVAALVEELVQEGVLHGSLKAGGGVWVPQAHARAQQDSVLAFFRQNQYIGYDMLAKLGVSGDPLEYIYPLLPDGFALSSAFVDPSLLEQVEAAADEALADSSWVDVQPLLPSAFNANDASLLLAECPTVEGLGTGKKAEGKVYAGTCLVSSDMLEELRDKACAEARSLAAAALERRSSAASTSTSDAPSASAGASKAAPQDAGEDSDDDWGGAGKGGSKKKKGKRRNTASTKTKQHAQSKQKESDPAVQFRERLSADALATLLVVWVPEMEACGEDGALAHDLAEDLRGPAQAEFDAAMSAVFTAGAEARKRRRDAHQLAFNSAWAHLQAHLHGYEKLSAAVQSKEDVALSAIQRYAVRMHALTAVDHLLQLLQVDTQGDVEGDQDGLTPNMSASDRVALLNQLPPDLDSPARAAVDKANGVGLQEAVISVEALAEASGTHLRKLDRKAEKGLVSEHIQSLQAQLTKEADPAAALSVAVPLLIAQVFGVTIGIPGKALGTAIGCLKLHMSETSHQTLSDYHTQVVNSLKGQGSAEQTQRLQHDLEHQLSDLKSIAGISIAQHA